MFVATDTPTEPMYQFMQAEDHQQYGAWCAPYVAKFNPVPTAPLYHYTAGSGLIEIVRSGELWATQLACLNDASEFLYPIDLLLSKVRAALKTPLTTEVKFLLEKVEAGLSEPQIATEGRFIACFSEDGDDLSQWRSYGAGEGGYAIEFDAAALRTLKDGVTILGKVEYDEKYHLAFIDDVLNHTISFFLDGVQKKRAPTLDAWRDEFLRYWASIVSAFAPFLKHPKFRGEREWRLVYHLQDEAIPRMRYLQRSSMMTKHVPLRLAMKDGSPHLPLTRVIVGPCRHKAISKISVGDLLRTHGYAAPVSITAIPYQAV